MISTSGIWNHATAQTASPTLTSMDSSSDGSGSSTSSSATISANDFLTLLVTEMQNQDPTADTDPNEYINQLVNVNSLEQLIDINQTLSTALGGSTTSSGSTGSTGTTSGTDALGATTAVSQAAQSAGAHLGAQSAAVHPVANGSPSMFGAAPHPALQPSAAHRAPGNLSIPNVNPSAQRVAQSLSGH
jgi:flagellar basal-body rod modification protein FlgD